MEKNSSYDNGKIIMFGWVQNMFKLKLKFLSPLSPAFLPSPPLNNFLDMA
jgi:hypothetical protein